MAGLRQVARSIGDGVNVIRQKCFAYCFDWQLPLLTAAFHVHRTNLFNGLKGLKAIDPELRSQGLIRILEIGAGSGGNFKYYPDNARLICVEPNPHFFQYFEKNIQEHKNVTVERCIEGFGEDLGKIEDGTIDAVVTSFVMCSVRDMNQVLKEIRRVLAPGGTYYFLEHVLAPPGTCRNIFQRAINPTWAFVMDGCNLSRDIESAIRSAEFSVVTTSPLDVTSPISSRLFVRPQLIGTAQK